jgi:glycosyltransferase involved in cell wall biosynthesis
MKPLVSVIVPVFDNPEGLRSCLAALEGQTYPADRYEVIVADNGSREDPAPIVAEFPHARLVREARVGSYAARNAAVLVAKGAVFAFTDSDCLPAPSWLARGVERIGLEADLGLVAGGIEMFVRDEAKPTIAELVDLHEWGLGDQQLAEETHFGATANVFTTRAVWKRVGPFDARLKSGGDLEWGNRAHAQGLRVVFAPEAVVRHPARRTFREVKNRVVRLAGGAADRQRRSGRSLLPLLVRVMKPEVRRSARIARNPQIAGVWKKLACISMLQRLRFAELGSALRALAGAESAR